MASSSPSVTRASSADSLSELSNIEVGRGVSVASGRATASTPPTSVADTNSMTYSKPSEDVETIGRRSTRVRAPVVSYNVNQMFEASRTADVNESNDGNVNSPYRRKRAFLQETRRDTPTRVDATNFLETDWDVPDDVAQTTSLPKKRKAASVKERVQSAVKKVAAKVSSVLGKRKFEQQAEPSNPKQTRILKELDMGKRGVLDELDLDAVFAVPTAPRPSKKAKVSHTIKQTQESTAATFGALQKTSDGKVRKKWQPQGLFVGQDLTANPAHHSSEKIVITSSEDSSELQSIVDRKPPSTERSFMPLPMFNYLDKTRDFIIPFDVFAPSLKKGDERPKDWHKINRNRIVGEAREIWEKADRLPASACVCQHPGPGELGCEYDCLNRVMQYECNEDNCILPPSLCSNRAFAELAVRTKKGGSFDIGVEVIKTASRGFGVRACRTFAPGQIIMEYTGEIISETECQRRMREVYKDRTCYYLMELERNLVIDGTKGSMARFINHSCEPNCEVRMVKVNGIPRMGVFAGESGISTGQELTYDYNFDNFGETRQICYCGAPTCRGYLSKRLNAAEQKKQAKEEMERQLKAAAEAQKRRDDEGKRKKLKDDRGSNWRGWVSVDDSDVKEKLKEEKRRREEAEMNSSRAKRMAARRGSLSAADQKPMPKTGSSDNRRKTIAVDSLHPEETSKSSFSKPLKTPASSAKRSRTYPEPEAPPRSTKSLETALPTKSSILLTTESNTESTPSQHIRSDESCLEEIVTVARKDVRTKSTTRASLDNKTIPAESKLAGPQAGKSNSILAKASRVAGSTVKASTKAVGSTKTGLKQSTLNFVKSSSN